MATSCEVAGQFSLQALYRGAETLNPSARSALFGGGSIFPTLDRLLSNGTGSAQANALYVEQRPSLAAAANDDIDLAGGLATLGTTLTFTVVKYVMTAIVSPTSVKRLRVGPGGVANAWQGPWGGTGATVYDEVWDWRDWSNPYSGWTVTAGTGDILRINNPSAGAVSYVVLIVGVV